MLGILAKMMYVIRSMGSFMGCVGYILSKGECIVGVCGVFWAVPCSVGWGCGCQRHMDGKADSSFSLSVGLSVI